MWVPNIILGAAGIFLLINRARSADQPIRISLPRWITRWRRDETAGESSAGRPGRRKPRPLLVLRVPHLRLPGPTLLDAYIAKQYLRILLLTVVGLLGLFYISTFIDMSDKVFKGQASLGMVGEFLFWSTPEYLSYITALAVLLAALVTVGLLTKNSELIVMRACGISIYRTALPMVAFALGASAFLFGMEERVLAPANQRADRLKHIIRTGSPQTIAVNRKWIVGSDGAVYHYQYYDPTRRELHGLLVFEFDRDTHALKSRMFVQKATYDPDRTEHGEDPKWAISSGWRREFDSKMKSTFTPLENVGAKFEAAESFVTEAREPELMNFGQLRNYIAELKKSGYNVLDHEVGLQRKIAFPFVTLVMTLIAVPFAVTTGRRGAMYGIGVGIVLALVYWTMISVFAAFGQGGLIDPLLAAWAPNLIFGAAAAYLLLTVRT